MLVYWSKVRESFFHRCCFGLTWTRVQDERTFEGEKEENCHQDQQHTEGERQDGDVDLKGERR